MNKRSSVVFNSGGSGAVNCFFEVIQCGCGIAIPVDVVGLRWRGFEAINDCPNCHRGTVGNMDAVACQHSACRCYL